MGGNPSWGQFQIPTREKETPPTLQSTLRISTSKRTLNVEKSIKSLVAVKSVFCFAGPLFILTLSPYHRSEEATLYLVTMASNRNPRKSGSSLSKTSTHQSSANRAESGNDNGNPGGAVCLLPSDTPSVIHRPIDRRPRGHHTRFTNKVVLEFEEEYNAHQVGEWLYEYNQISEYYLTLFIELSHSLFVIQFDTEDPEDLEDSKRSLLAASPLGANRIYASVNDFSLEFAPCNQADFKHLVTIIIAQGDWEILGSIRLIASIIGKYVKSLLGSDQKHISLVVETTRKLFPTHGKFQLNKHNDKITTVSFGYIGLPPRYHNGPLHYADHLRSQRTPRGRASQKDRHLGQLDSPREAHLITDTSTNIGARQEDPDLDLLALPHVIPHTMGLTGVRRW